MARICKHVGCETANSRIQLNLSLCPECGFALYPAGSRLRLAFPLLLLCCLILVGWCTCRRQDIQTDHREQKPTIYFADSLAERGTARSSPFIDSPTPKASDSEEFFVRAENLADSIPYQPNLSATALAFDLAHRGRGDEIGNPQVLAALVYRWVGRNISYDVDSLDPTSRAPQDPDKVLKAGKAVCEGYACLCNFLLNQNQVESRIVHGLSRSGEGRIGREMTMHRDGHAWIAVKWDGKWHLLEPTWGAGSVASGRFQASFSWEWFDFEPEIAIYSHIPEQDEMQLLRSSVSVSKIQQAASLSRDFFKAVDLPPLPLVSGSVTQSSNASALAWKLRPGFRIAADAVLVGGGGKQTAQVFTLPSGVTELRFPGLLSGTYTVSIFVGETGQKTLQQCGYFQLKQMGTSTTARPPALFRGYHELGVRLCVPVVADLVSGAWQRFSLNADPGLTFGLQFDGETTMEYLSFNNGVYENRVFLHPGKLRLWQVENKKMNCVAEFEVN